MLQFLRILQIIYFHTNRMDKDSITIEPEIIQLTPDSRQMIKIINKTNEPIENCFFCLFNVNKFQFSPESFSLLPKQHKIINVSFKLKALDTMGKEFAYLKSKSFTKRFTLIYNPQQTNTSAEKMRSVQEGVEEINTLTSRDYKQSQKSAYEKIIAEKQAYILKLQRRLQQNSFHEEEKDQTQLIKNKKLLDEIQNLNLQVAILGKEKQQLMIENIDIHAKFKEYRIKAESDQRFAEMQGQAEEIKLLELQCQQFLRKIQEKQSQIEQSQYLYASKIDGIIKEGEKQLQLMEQKIQEERKNTQQLLKNQTQQQTQRLEQKLSSIQAELGKKQKQIKLLRDKLEQEETKNKEISAETKRALKLEQQKEMLAEQTKQLKEKLTKMQNSYASLKQETIIFKSKLNDQDESSEKMHQYLQMALESCKNENQILKKSKLDIEHLLAEEGKSKRYYESKVQGLEQSTRDMLVQIKQMQEQLTRMNDERIAEKEQNHDKLMQLKSQNVDLLQKISANRRKQIERNGQVEDLKQMIAKSQEQQQKMEERYNKISQDFKQCLEEKDKMEKKIDKYRRQAKKSIKSIRENAQDQLNKLEEQKNQLSKKVQQLEISALNAETKDLYNPEARHKTRTLHEEGNRFPNTQNKQKHPMSLEGDQHRRVGIRNQRRQLEESQANSQSALDMDRIYGELGQLRELKNYVNNQIRKLKPTIGIDELSGCDQNMNANGNSIFSVINFFKQLEHRLADQFGNRQKLISAQKQIEFLKGRLSQLEPIAKTLKSKQKKLEQISSIKPQIDRSAIEYIREEMKNQYKKLYDSLKLSQEKYEILRKKIYEEYRARIIELISKKDRDEFTVNKIQAVLERFVEGLGNTSHKQAVLAKQIKLKQQARKQASLLKGKLTTLAKQAQLNTNKKGNSTCIREPLKVFQIQNDQQWLDAVRMEAKVLTFQAQNARLLADKELYLLKLNEITQQLKRCQGDLELKEQEIQNLKKQVIEISKQYQLQKQKQQSEMGNLGKKFEKMQKMEKQINDLTIKQKENTHLRDELQQKRQIIKSLRERQKMLEQLLDQSKKNESTWKERDRKEGMEESRMQQSLKGLMENNRQLRNQNSKLKDQIDSLMDETNKKNAALKRLKSQTQQFRIKSVKNEAESIQKLRSEMRELKQQLKRSKDQHEKYKRKREKDISEKLSEMDRLKSEFSIEKSSLESIIRALTDTIKSIYCSLDIIARKKGKVVGEEPKFDSLISHPGEIKTNKIRQCFEDVIEALKN